MIDKPYLTIKEVAGCLCVSKEAVSNWLRQGRLRYSRFGTVRCVRIARGELNRFIANRTRGGGND